MRFKPFSLRCPIPNQKSILKKTQAPKTIPQSPPQKAYQLKKKPRYPTNCCCNEWIDPVYKNIKHTLIYNKLCR